MIKAPAVTVILLLLAAPLFAARVEKRTLQSGGRSRSYSLFVPDGLAAPAPLLVTLHGSGRKGDSLVEAWRGLAQKSGVIVAGPDSAKSEQWESPIDGPQLLHDVIEEVKS